MNNPENIERPQDICLHLFLKDLEKLQVEIESFSEERQIWQTLPGIANSAGNLCLHICGNLQHFIGAILGNTGYIRNREAEFASRNISKTFLIQEIDSTMSAVQGVLSQISEEEWSSMYPLDKFKEPVRTAYLINHLMIHLGYHLGQINYLRRALSNP